MQLQHTETTASTLISSLTALSILLPHTVTAARSSTSTPIDVHALFQAFGNVIRWITRHSVLDDDSVTSPDSEKTTSLTHALALEDDALDRLQPRLEHYFRLLYVIFPNAFLEYLRSFLRSADSALGERIVVVWLELRW